MMIHAVYDFGAVARKNLIEHIARLQLAQDTFDVNADVV